MSDEVSISSSLRGDLQSFTAEYREVPNIGLPRVVGVYSEDIDEVYSVVHCKGLNPS